MEDFDTFEQGYKNLKESSKYITKMGDKEFYILDDIFIYVVDLDKEEIESFDIENDNDQGKLIKKFGTFEVVNLIKYYSTWKKAIPDLTYDEFEADVKTLQTNKHIIFTAENI